MVEITDEMLDAVLDAMRENGIPQTLNTAKFCRVMLAAVAPLIEAQARERIEALEAELRDERRENNRLGEMLHAMRDEIDQILRRAAN